MQKAFEDAIEKVRRLPDDRQALAAEILETLVVGSSEPFVVPDSHREAVLTGFEEAQRGDFASEAEVQELLRRPWR